MTEAILSIALAASVFAGLAGVLNAEWDRTRCSILAFESAHRRLVAGEASRLSRLASLGKKQTVRVTETSFTVTAEASCGHAIERVQLVKLEAAEW